MRLALLAIAASCLWAQAPQIHGTVIEQGPNKGLPGVEVTLVNFVPVQDTLDERKVATIFTDAQGRFAFQPPALGEYRLDIQKPGYSSPDTRSLKTFVILTKDRPSQEFRFTLMNPSGLTGRFLDEQDKPIAGLFVLLQPLQAILAGAPRNITTDAQGTFTVTQIPPGEYLVQTMASRETQTRILDYSDAEFAKVDRELEHPFWPSGTSNRRDALPVTLPPGATATLGTLRVRQVDHYRLHVKLEGACSGKGWKYALVPQPQLPGRVDFSSAALECREEFLVRGIEPGSYQFAVWNEAGSAPWALEPFTISNRNTSLTLRIAPGTDVPGRFVAAEGSQLPSSEKRRFAAGLAGESSGLPTSSVLSLNPDGTFLMTHLPWRRYQVSVRQLPPTHYVREIRYGGVVSSDGWISLAAGSTLEIELDEHPAAISGTVSVDGRPATDRIMILLARVPIENARFNDSAAPFAYNTVAETGGVFQFGGLGPGEYRMIAMQTEDFLNASMTQRLGRLLEAGERVVLERGQQKSFEFKLKSPR